MRDDWGAFFYLRNRATGRSGRRVPATAAVPDHYAVDFLEDRRGSPAPTGDIATTLEIVVSPEDDAEIRRLSLANHGPAPVEIGTDFLRRDRAGPARRRCRPSGVFQPVCGHRIFTPGRGLVARRRPRGAGEPERWAGQVLAGVAADAGVEYETDRMRCLGRGRGVRSPLALQDGGPLGNSVGPVLDPVFCFRVRLRIEPGAVAHTVFTTFVAQNRDDLQELALKYRDPALFDRVSALAWTQAQVQLRHLRIATDEAQLFQALANRLLYADAALRPSGAVLALNTLGQRALWRHGISGDRPMVLARIGDAGQRALAEQLLRAQEYWRAKRLAVDLVFLCEQDASYAEELGGLLESLARAQRALSGAGPDPVRGAVAVVRADWLDEADRLLLRSSARVVLAGWRGTLAEQLLRRARGPAGYAPLRRPWTGAGPADLDALAGPDPSTLEFFNGLGGFTDGGRDYVVRLGPGQSTPLPWTNVIANPDFGFLVTESGGGYTWSLNSRENPLTPWSNDPVGDPPGEAFYLRDEDSGELWCPTALPIRVEGGHYLIRHGQGYSRFDHASHGIHSALTQCVDPADPVKVSILRLRDTSGRPRRLSVVAYAEWALGNSRPAAAPYVVTESDPATGALLARNPWSAEFGGRVAFADLGGRPTAWTASREEFLGRNGGLDAPAGLLGRRAGLRRRCGAGLDPCAALQTGIELGPGGTAEVVFLLGQGADRAGALDLIRRHRAIPAAETLERARRAWDERLGALQIQTPDRGLDLLVNRWLVYQALGCRVWARAAFYQAGGAYGFRDQLQDGMALAAADPAGVRAHLLRAAGRQFPEGDVQHWWHPPTGRGVRTHCSDDRLWLPVAAVRYLDVSGDAAVLDEEIPFIDGPPLPPEREDAYFEPTLSEVRASLYEHCARALDASLALGPHSLPLIGAGDWNDGMNRVGQAGRGESVWLAWFLISALEAFIPLAAARDDAGRADRWRGHAERLKAAAEAAAWDGAWYRRAWFDDGTPLGSAANAECRIDSLPQSWAALSGAADPERARRALDAVWERLVRGGDSLVLLFDPPFRRGADPDSHATPDPGYIAGYPPGTRENGGQYTHAAVWCALAETRLDNGSGAVELLRMLNPVYRGADKAGREAYRGEPYVLAADVHAGPEHARRAGWTWYTGAAGWYYRTAVEGVLGLELRAGTLFVDPCPPTAWPGFAASLRRGSARYGIAVENPQGVRRGVAALELDGEALPPQGGIPLADDGREHRVRVVMG
ncbi:GH36-type glycosyl hydrolase domain-containing protein [Methylomagnum ishizawai]|uniref:GH36-type glycosyl hydrolase domain-containing protein n=1 Tax=Methylomagnum ishizawai TaxID=1760988 RepID=UPI0020CB2150|nr:hypothetical protein [Methylomagnum ishizawai]